VVVDKYQSNDDGVKSHWYGAQVIRLRKVLQGRFDKDGIPNITCDKENCEKREEDYIQYLGLFLAVFDWKHRKSTVYIPKSNIQESSTIQPDMES